MKSNLLRTLFIVLPLQFTYAQLFTHSPDNLPTNGATGQSMDVKAADLDGDGDLDLVLANEFQRNTLLLNDGQGQFTNPFNIPNVIHDSEDIAIADYDQDGDLDLIFCSEDDIIHEYYLNDGEANFSAHPSFQFPNSIANAVISEDFNGDNIPDILFGNAGQNRIFINLGDGTFAEETTDRLPTSSETTQDLHLSDIDQDGDLDLLVGNEGNSKVLINNGNGVFTDDTDDRLPIHPNVETRKISSGDVNGDGAPDLFYSNVAFLPTSGLYRSNILFLNDSNGYFTDVSAEGLPNNSDDTLDAILEDVDGDGDVDLVIANVNLQSVANQQIYINDGEGNFTDQTTEVLGTLFFHNALGVIAADLNNDGLRDLYFCERNLGNEVKDLFFLKSMINTVDSKSENLESSIRLFPNPVVDSFTLESSFLLTDPTSLELFDHASRKVSDLEYTRIDTQHILVKLPSTIPSGSYYLQITIKEQVVTQPLKIID
jgi:hypothetical protein